METIEALKELAEKVSVDLATFDWTSPSWPFGLPAATAEAAYQGSLDAAKALHEAVLPGWIYAIHSEITGDMPKAAGVLLVPTKNRDVSDDECAEAEGDCLAHAWLLAIIRAKITELGPA